MKTTSQRAQQRSVVPGSINQVGSPERAAAFLNEFLRNGIEANGHVRPQLEFFLPMPDGCSVATDFIAKEDRDWIGGKHFFSIFVNSWEGSLIDSYFLEGDKLEPRTTGECRKRLGKHVCDPKFVGGSTL